VLAWTKPPAGTTQVLNYRAIGDAWKTVDTVYEVSATLSGADASVLPDGEYEYELLWTPSGKPLPTSHATGTFKVTAAVTERQASGKPNITGIDVGITTVSWNTKIDATAIAGTPRFEWRRLPDTAWKSISEITTANGRASVDIRNFKGGAHEFRISYELNGEQTALGTVMASLDEPDFSKAPPPVLSNRLTVPASGFAINSAGNVLSWVNTGTNSKFEYRERAAEGQPATVGWTALATTRIGTSGSVDISSLGGGKKYEFRITSEEAEGATVTIGAGNLTTYVTGGGIPQPPQVNSTTPPAVTALSVVGQELSWNDIPGTTVRVEGRYKGAYVWSPLDVLVSPPSGGKLRLDMGGVQPGDYEVRISHYSGDTLVAFDARGVEVFPNPSAAPYFVDLTSGRAIDKFTQAGGTLSWTRPAYAATGTALFQFSDANNPNDPPHVREVISSGATDSISLAGLPAGMHFKVTYKEGGVVIGGGAGTLVPGGPAAIVPVAIGGIRVSDGRLRWAAPGEGQTTRVYMRVDGVFTLLNSQEVGGVKPVLANGEYSIAVPLRTEEFASYEYLIQYLDVNGQEIAVGAARVELSPKNVRGDHVLFAPLDGSITNIRADHRTFSWDLRPGTPKVEARLLGSGSEWEVLKVLPREAGATRESVDIAGANNRYEWRITYTDPATGGDVSAIASGTLDITSPTPVLSNLTSSRLTGLAFGPGRMQWVRPAGTTRLSIKVQNPENGHWDELPSTYLSTEGNLQVVDLSHTGAGPSQVLITYFTGSDVTHVMRGTVTTFLPGTATVEDKAVAVFPPTSSDFSWTDIPGAGTPFFQYRLRTDANGPWRGDLPVGAPADGKRHVNISSLDGNYEYRVSYTSGSLVAALATGQLDIVRPHPQLSATDGAVLKNMSANATRWSWDRPAGEVIGTVKFRALGGAWSEPIPVGKDGSRDYVDAVNAPIGTFEYAITYTELGFETSFSTGVVVVNPPTLVSADRADIQGVTQGPSSLSWTPHANAAATAKFAYRGSSDLTGAWTDLDVQMVDGKAKVDLTGLHGAYDYRISYELGNKEVVALDAGRINISTTAPTVLSQGASRLQGITATASQLKWVAQDGTLKVEYRASGSEVVQLIPNEFLARNVGGYDAVDLSRFGAIGGDFRITYTNTAGLITAMAIGEVTGPGWSSPAPNATANVTGVNVNAAGTTLSWTSTHTGTPRFFYRVNGGSWTDGPQPNGSSVDITGVLNTTAVYEYRIVYSDGAGMTALGMGRLTVNAASASLGSSAGGQVGGFYADRRQVSWATPAGAVGAPVVFVRQAGYGWEGPMPLLGQNALDLSNFGGSGTWEIRVAYSNGGQLTHLGTASFALASPTVSAQTSSDIVGIAGEPGPRLAWNAMPGTPVLEYLDVASGQWLSAADAQVGTLFANDGTGRAGFNFTQLPPSNFSFRITYQLNGDTKGFASGQIYFNGGTAAPGVQTNSTAFGASITASLSELRWTPPAGTTASQGQVIYRVPGGNWTSGGAVQVRGTTHFVDISSIAAGTYEFRIHYASGATILGGATPTVQIHASPGLINPAMASLGSFTLSGTQLSWTAPAAGGTPVFEYNNGSSWIPGPPVGTLNGKPSVNVQDIYGVPVNFRVRYMAGGHDVAFGSGSFNATRATQNHEVLSSGVGNYRVEFGKLLWNRPASAVGTAMFSRRPSAGGAWISVAANESFDLSVLGSGSWDYRVTYSSNGVETFFGSGTIIVPTSVLVPVATRADIGPVTAPLNGTTLEWAPSVYPEAVATFKAFSNGQWVSKAVSTVNGKHSASVLGLGSGALPFRIEYTIGDMVVGLLTGSFSVGSTGTPVILNSTRGEVEGVSMAGSTLSWTRPAEVNGTAKVYVRRTGQEWEAKTVSGETANLSDILNNHHEFRIEYTDANGQVIASAVGTLEPQSVQVLPTATTNVSGFAATRTRLSWDKPALSGVTEHFEYYEPGANTLLPVKVIDDVGGRRAIDVTGLEDVGYHYRVVYRDTATGDIKALGTGIFRVGVQATPVLTPVVSTIGQPVLTAGRMVWERPPSVPAGSTALFERKDSNGYWYGYDIPVTAHDATHDRIELSKLSAGTHEWRVKYTSPAGVVMGIGAGTLVVPQTVTLTNEKLGNVTGIQSDSTWLSWDPMDTEVVGTLKVEIYDASTQQWIDATENVDIVNGRPTYKVAGVVGTHDFRISYGKLVDGERQVMALARAQFTGTAGTATCTVNGSPVRDFEVVGNELSWTPASGSLEVHRMREGTSSWESISPVNANGSRHNVTIGDIEAGNYQYRIVYKEGGVVTAVALIGVTIDVGIVVERRPAEVKEATRTITDFTVPAQTHDIRWTRNPDGGTAVFEYRRQGTAEWLSAPVGSFGAQDGVDVRSLNLSQGGYEFRVHYRSGQGPYTLVSANGAGRFTVPAPLAGTQKPTLQLNTAPAVLSNIAATPSSVTWNAPPDSTGHNVYVETRLIDAAVWEGPVNVTRGGATDGAHFDPVGYASTYEFRITYTDGAGVVTAIGSAVVTFGDAPDLRTKPTVEVTTPPYLAYRAAAEAKYELTPTTASTPHAISDPRLGFTADHAPGNKPGAYALQPKIMQKLDRWGNVIETTDPRNAQWTTTYKWNWANQLVEQVRPVDGALGASPTTRIYYDALGRQVGIQDANGNLSTKTYDMAGNLVEEGQADGGRITHRYDALGNKVQTTDAVGNEAQRTDSREWTASERETAEQAAARRLGHTTDFSYDRMGRLLKAEHGQANVYAMDLNTDPQRLKLTLSAPTWRRIAETYTYDEAGRKLKQTNGNNETTSYKYDAAGHVVETRQPLGTRTTATYNAFGYKISEMDANSVRAQTWDVDAYGRVKSHTDLSGALISYKYDNAGLLQTLKGSAHTVNGVTVAAQEQEFKYDQAGQLLEILDKGVGRTTTYQYDAAGNHVLERTEQVVERNKLLLQDNHLGYDAQGRLRQIFDGHLSIAIDYDLNGNRKKITTGISVLSGAGASQETVHNSVRNFEYDAMNRQTVVEEYNEDRRSLDGGQPGIVRHEIKYYVDGNRKSDKFFGNKVVANGGDEIIVSYSNDSGEATYTTTTPITYEKVDGLVEERYHYDNLGRLMSVVRDGTQVDLRRYDGAGRALQTGSPGNLPKAYTDKLNEGIPASEQIASEMRLSNYDANGRLVFQNTYGGDGSLRMGMDYIDRGDGNGYDAAGNLKGFRQHVPKAGVIETHSFTQGQFDGYVVASETARDKDGKNVVTSRIEYDANGHQKRIVDEGKPANNRNIYSDTAGRALLVDQGGKLQRQLIVNGEVLGNYGIGLDDLTPKDKNRDPVFAPHVDFEWGYQQINGHYPGASPGAYTVRQGDTLQGIARGAYGDSRMWYRIAEANGLSSDSDLKVGQTLVIPAGVGVHNASDTFEPYDPSKVVGDTSPTLPVPAAKKGCGAIGQIVMIVVAVVVTFFTAGAAAAYFGVAMAELSAASVAIAAGAAAVGSIASQAVGIAIGAQEKFSWKQVAIAAVSAGVTQGVTPGSIVNLPSGAADIPGRMAQAAAINAATQGIAVVTGLQDKFSWRGVAAAAAGTGVGQAVGGALNGAFGTFAGRLATGFVAGATAAAMRGGKVSVRQIATDAFGNALGNAVVDGMTSDRDPSNSNYRNEMDRESDAATNARQWAELNRTGGNFARMDGASYRGEPSASKVFADYDVRQRVQSGQTILDYDPNGQSFSTDYVDRPTAGLKEVWGFVKGTAERMVTSLDAINPYGSEKERLENQFKNDLIRRAQQNRRDGWFDDVGGQACRPLSDPRSFAGPITPEMEYPALYDNFHRQAASSVKDGLEMEVGGWLLKPVVKFAEAGLTATRGLVYSDEALASIELKAALRAERRTGLPLTTWGSDLEVGGAGTLYRLGNVSMTTDQAAAAFSNARGLKVDLFGGDVSQLAGSVNVDITATAGVRADLTKGLGFLPDGSVSRLTALNPFIPGRSGGFVGDILGEAARVLEPGGEMTFAATKGNSYVKMNSLPSVNSLNSMGFDVAVYKQPLTSLDNYAETFSNVRFGQTAGKSPINPQDMIAVVLRKRQ
jgi:YD repeat-containing protein